jgi:hypothetical protein
VVVCKLVEGTYTLNGVLPLKLEALCVYGSFLRHIFSVKKGVVFTERVFQNGREFKSILYESAFPNWLFHRFGGKPHFIWTLAC